jgi:hypothetical protein
MLLMEFFRRPGMPSFARDIRRLFRDKDVEEMRFAFDLSQYEDVKRAMPAAFTTALDGSMPCDGAWPDDRITLFGQWIQEGYSP